MGRETTRLSGWPRDNDKVSSLSGMRLYHESLRVSAATKFVDQILSGSTSVLRFNHSPLDLPALRNTMQVRQVLEVLGSSMTAYRDFVEL